jgi:hypothetical protein
MAEQALPEELNRRRSVLNISYSCCLSMGKYIKMIIRLAVKYVKPVVELTPVLNLSLRAAQRRSNLFAYDR